MKDKEKPKTTIQNFEIILNNDPMFKGKIKYDCLGDNLEFNGEMWGKNTDSQIRAYIERKYSLYHKSKLSDALNVVFAQNTYNPIQELLKNTRWDGKNRIGRMFNKWLRVDDTPLNREIERMMFMGGINRLHNFGCKFDDVVVLMGEQGCGKSTFCLKLALVDKYFNEIKNIEGDKAIEAIKDYWICELAELMALTKAKDVEAVKAFLSRCSDKARLAYEERVTERPRHNIIIGTTNKYQFLSDKTGDRRYYPIKCNTRKYENLLLSNERECDNDMLQAWKEADLVFEDGKANTQFNKNLIPELEVARRMASEDDYREGMLESFLKLKTKTCIIECYQKGLEQYDKPDKKTSGEIGQILRKLGFEAIEKRDYFKDYGQQRVFIKRQ